MGFGISCWSALVVGLCYYIPRLLKTRQTRKVEGVARGRKEIYDIMHVVGAKTRLAGVLATYVADYFNGEQTLFSSVEENSAKGESLQQGARKWGV